MPLFLLLFYFHIIAGLSTWKLYLFTCNSGLESQNRGTLKKLFFSATGDEKQSKTVDTPLSPIQGLSAVHFEAS